MKNFDLVILGAGESGVGCAILAAQKGISVLVSDAGMIAEKYQKELREQAIYFEQGAHTHSIILEAKEVIKSPGIPSKAPIVQALKSKGVPVISELDFAQRYSNAKVVAITGTNGKTTTTTMVYELLKRADLSVGVAGNIGFSYARLVAQKSYDYIVLEVSSFQLDDSYTFHPNVAILMNITPDHLDRYNYNYSEYIASKFRIAQHLREGDRFIYCADNQDTVDHLNAVPNEAEKWSFSYYTPNYPGAWVENKVMHISDPLNKLLFTMNTENFALKGIHNAYNSMAAALVGTAFNVRKEVVRESLASFSNVEHRLEFVASVRGIDFINDSKATNVNSAWYALESVEKPIIWIAGGVDKGNDYEQLLPLVKDKVKLIICLGVDNSKLHNAFGKHVDLMLNTQSMQEAVSIAYRFGEKGDTVLLSPACASFDLFLNYQDRGQAFKQFVKNL